MKLQKKLYALVLLLAILSQSNIYAQSFTETQPEKLGFSSERLDYLTKTFEGFVEDDALPGSVILVARKGEIAYYKAFGKRDIEQNDQMEKSDIFRIASQTKATVSVGIMILQERGLRAMSEPVGRYIAGFNRATVAVADEDGGCTIELANRGIAIRDLLVHAAGVGYGKGVAAEAWEEAVIQGWYFAD